MALGFGRKNSRRDFAPIVDDDLVGLIEPGIELEGKLKYTTGMVRLNAHYRGEISCDGTVIVADQGEVEAEIQAKVVSISGKVKGSIHATERLEIREHGVVLGDIFTPSLVIEPGGYFDGQCHMPEPDSQKQPTPDISSKDSN